MPHSETGTVRLLYAMIVRDYAYVLSVYSVFIS